VRIFLTIFWTRRGLQLANLRGFCKWMNKWGDWKCETGIIGTIKNAGVENAGLELSAWNCRGGKSGTKQLWKATTPAGHEVSLLLLNCYGSRNRRKLNPSRLLLVPYRPTHNSAEYSRLICVKSNYRRGHATDFKWVSMALSIKLVCHQTGSKIFGEFSKFGGSCPPKVPENNTVQSSAQAEPLSVQPFLHSEAE